MTNQPRHPPLARSALWVVGARIVGIVTTVATSCLTARLLGPADFGVFLLGSTVLAFGGVLGMAGLNEAALRFVSRSLGLGEPELARAFLRQSLRAALLTSIAAAALVALGLSAFQAIRGELDQPWLIVSLAAIGVVALAWQQLAAEALRGYGDLRSASLFSGGQTGGPVSNLLFLGGLGAAALLHPAVGLGAAMCLLVISICATLPFALWRLLEGSAAGPRPDHVAPDLAGRIRRELFTTAGSLLVIQLLTFATYQLDIWIGGALLSPADLGLYGAAKRCQLLAQMPSQMAMMAVISAVPHLYAQNRIAELEAVVRRAATWAAAAALPALVLLALFPDKCLQLFFGGSYLGAAAVMAPLLLGQLAHVLLGNPAYVLTMTGRHALVLRINALAVGILVGCGAYGAATAGPVGLALGSALSLAAQNGLLWWFARTRLGVRTHVGPCGELIAAVFHKSRSFLGTLAGTRTIASPAAGMNVAGASATSAKAAGFATSPAIAGAVPFARNQGPGFKPSAPARPVAARSAPGTTLRRLWWLYPAWPFAGVVGPTIVAAWLQHERAYQLYGMPKYVELEHLVMGLAAILALTMGCLLAGVVRETPGAERGDVTPLVRKSFRWLTALTMLGYVTWFIVGFKNGFRLSMIPEMMFDDSDIYYSIRWDYFVTIPGVTTCTQFGVAAFLLGAWLLIHGERRGVVWPMAAVFAAAVVRCLLLSERTAVLELVLPLFLVGLRSHVLGQPATPTKRWLWNAAPVLGAVALVVFFGIFEYYRSWKFYRASFDSFAEFNLWRLSGYFTTAHNNGAMALATNQPRPLPYFTLRPLWEFPGIRATPFSYENLTGFDLPAVHTAMLERYGSIELNNEGGLFQPALDYGWAGYLVYWFGYGYASMRVYRSYLAGKLAGIVLYPLVVMSLLEAPLILFLFYTRTFPPLAALLVVAWLAGRVPARGAAPARAQISVS